MKEISDIIRSFDAAQLQGKKTALATVVQVEGSSYRRPGARMLIAEDGQLTGAISGGCLEGDALRKALFVMAQQQAMLVTYNTMDEDDATIGIGLGCNGIIQVLIEPIDPTNPVHPVQLLKKLTAKRQEGVLVTLFSLTDRKGFQPGTCMLLDGNGNLTGTHHDLSWKNELTDVRITCQSAFRDISDGSRTFTAFIDFVPPAIALVIAGAGNDVLPLLEIATVLGWETTIADGRANYAKPERFTSACQVVVAKPDQILQHIAIDDYTVFALMTHNYNYDKALLAALLEKDARLVGMLGPRKKFDRMLEEFAAEGVVFSAAQLKAVYSPFGLDIGAETPEEIALSIVAEIKAVLAGKPGTPLREKVAGIHD